MYGHLPSTNNTAEATNSVESRLARHNAELIPSIHDSYRMTVRQQQQHEGILSGAPLLPEFTLFLLMTHSRAATGQVKTKVSPTKRPVFASRRSETEDFDSICPDKVDTSAKPPLPPKRSGSPGTFMTPDTAKKRKPSLLTHPENDRVRRVSALIQKNEATPGLFVEVFPATQDVTHPDDRWFMQVTSATITGTGKNSVLRGKWCKTNCLIVQGGAQECSMRLSHVKDYGDRSIFTT
jgi:hypothetical protein